MRVTNAPTRGSSASARSMNAVATSTGDISFARILPPSSATLWFVRSLSPGMLGSPCRDERFAGVDVGDVYRAERGDSVAHGPHLGVQQVEVVVPGLYAESGRPLAKASRVSSFVTSRLLAGGWAALPRMTVEGQAWQVHGARAWRTRTMDVR